MKPSMKIVGGKVLVQNIGYLSIKATNAVAKASLTTANLIVNDAKLLCPVDTGRLWASLSFNWTDGPQRGVVKGKVTPKPGGKPSSPQDGVGPPDKSLPGFYASVGTNVEYAEDVENTISPYLWPAIAMNKERYRNLLSAALKIELAKPGKGGGGGFSARPIGFSR